MKKAIYVAAILGLTFSAFSSNATPMTKPTVASNAASVLATPPAAVLASFQANFGNVPVQQWKLRSNAQWRAHFVRNGIAWEATFTATGVLVKSERA